VQVNGSSSAYLWNNTIFTNFYGGVGITSNSIAEFGGGNKIYDNADNSGWRSGVAVFWGSSATFSPQVADNPDEIFENKGPGIYVIGTSELFLPSASVHNNNGSGVTIGQGSSCHVGFFPAGADIFMNTGHGVAVYNSSTVFLNSGSVHHNTGNGVYLGNPSTGAFLANANIDNNGLFGINCSGGAALATGDAGSVSGNGSGQTNCPGWTP
jgi:hypothetical protein